MKVIVTGATGMVGKGVLLECLDHPDVEKAVSISRSSTGITHPKLEEILHADFSDFSPLKERLTGFDACYLCMGVSVAGMNEKKYKVFTYEYTIALAKLLSVQNPQMTCTYVSGQGTDSTEKGKAMWARIKGMTENELLRLFKKAFMFRPGLIIPLRGIKSKTKAYQFVYDYFMWLVKLVRMISPNSVVTTTQLGKAMINITKRGYPENIITPGNIIALAEN